MIFEQFSRRGMLRALGLGVAAPSGMVSILHNSVETVHRAAQGGASEASERCHAPKFFDAHQYKTVQALCEAIIPPDEHSGGAIDARAPEFIDLLTSENPEYQIKLGGGLMWLDGICKDRYNNAYVDCSSDEQREILDLLAYRANVKKDPRLSQGVEFFLFLRDLTVDGFYTSQIGITDLKYMGNAYLTEFRVCPLPSNLQTLGGTAQKGREERGCPQSGGDRGHDRSRPSKTPPTPYRP